MAIACGVGVLLLVVRMMLKKRPVAEPERPTNRRETERREADQGVFGSLTDALASQIPESEQETSDFVKILRQAGLYAPSARSNVYAYRFLLLFFPLVCAGLLAIAAEPRDAWKFLVGGGFIAAGLSIIPRLYVYFRRQNRILEIRNGLADMLDMLSMCLNGGMPLSSSLDHVARNLVNYPSLAEELQIMRRQSDVGSLRMALQEWSNRMDIPEVRQVSSILSRGEQLGTSLSGSLLDQADHFRQTRKQLATLQANRTPVFMTLPLLFCFAPAVLLLLMSPAFMQISEFFNPQTGGNVLGSNNNTAIGGQLLDSINSIDQVTGTASGAPAIPGQARPGRAAPRRAGVNPGPGNQTLVRPAAGAPQVGVSE